MATFKCLLHLFERNSKHMSTPSSCQANNTRGYKRLLDSNICCHSIYSKKLSEKQTSDIRCISCVSYKIVLFYLFFRLKMKKIIENLSPPDRQSVFDPSVDCHSCHWASSFGMFREFTYRCPRCPRLQDAGAQLAQR